VAGGGRGGSGGGSGRAQGHGDALRRARPQHDACG